MKKTFITALLFSFFTTFSFAQNRNIVERARVSFPETLANICGYVKDGREYALLGGQKGMIIMEVTNPDAPKMIVRIPGIDNLWKEIKTYKNIAYVTTEGGGGLQIIDLNGLPDTNVTAYKAYNYVGDTTRNKVDTAIIANGRMGAFHSLHVDTTKGFVYLFGGNSTLSQGGAIVLDLKPDPYRPKYAGQFNRFYIHDGYVDNDTLFAAAISNGNFAVIDFRNKLDPTVLSTQQTPLAFTHNTWLTPNRKTLLATDERSGSYLASYDVSNVLNIKPLDKVQNLSSGSIVHNTQILRNGIYAVTSWYRDGINITDISRPNNMVVVGSYDTYLQGEGTGFEGAWGVYPYFPSGTLVVSDINYGDGFFVLTPQYKRACYLEGIVRDSFTKALLSNVSIKINSTDWDKKAISDIGGNYRTGQATPGTFSVTFSKTGYRTKTVNVTLSAGDVALRDVELVNATINRVPELSEDMTVSAAPNPFNHVLSIQYRLENKVGNEAILHVFDLLGREILSQKLQNTEGSLSLKNDWARGVYSVQIETNGRWSKPLKVIKTQ